MQTVYVDGKPVEDFSTRAEALVYCFERNLVYDNYARGKRNQLLPNVRIEGTDDADPIVYPSRHPLDIPRNSNDDGDVPKLGYESGKNRSRPKRGSLDDRSDDSSPRRIKDVSGKWVRLGK